MRIATLLIGALSAGMASAQLDPSLFVAPTAGDTARTGRLNMDAVYDRPFLTLNKIPVSLGGYVEAKGEHLGTDGVSEGLSFALRRMTLFVASSIHRRIHFLSEVELEEGGHEVSIEFAALDLELHPLFVLRGGIIMNPIGAFNQNHDGPKWAFTDRPLEAVELLPATWSNAGFGAYGKRSTGPWTFGYEAYLTNGFNARIISNAQDRTSLPAAKEDPERFSESANGAPMFTAKLSVRHERIGEVGVSTMGGVYNAFAEDGLRLDRRRRVDVLAVDGNTTLRPWATHLVAEWAWVFVDVPDTYTQQYGSRQRGGFLDIEQPVWRRPIADFEHAVVSVACRFEYVDLNVGTFRETGGNIGDDVWAIVPALSFRPVPDTVLRLNYRHERRTDLLGNPPSITGGIQFGVASYF